MKIPAKFFPFAARQPLWDMAKRHGKMKYTIVAIWEYMFWRSGKKNLFELADDLVCLDLGCDTHTLCGVRKVLQAEGWLKKEALRDKGGKWLTRGWTVIINLAPTCAKSPSGEDQPHGHEPHGHQQHVDVPHADEPHVVDYTALYPPTTGILQHSDPPVSYDPSISEKERRKEDSVLLPLEVETKLVELGNVKTQKQPPSIPPQIEAAWVEGGGTDFVNGDAESAERMLMTGAHATKELVAYIEDTFKCPKTARVAWKDFSYWARPENFDLTKRNIDAWRRLKKAKASDPASRPANPNCARCKGPTYGSPTYENDKPFCADCMKYPTYRRESGERTILKGDV